MEGETQTPNEAPPDATSSAANANEGGRQRSTISFTYDDLDAAVELANAIHTHVGHGECEDDQLAAWTGQSVKSSGFRTKIYAARIFGVLDGEGGTHRLSELGQSIVDPNQARSARAKAFLSVPLYKAVFDNHKGGVIPPTAALEREMVGLGVAEKQKGRARQVFERSADQAGFFENGRNRLVMPGVQPGEAGSKDQEAGKKKNGGGDGPLDPLIDALIKKLPKQGPWSVDERIMWLQMVAMAFQMAYGSEETIDIKKSV